MCFVPSPSTSARKGGGNPGPLEGRNTEEPASLPDTSTCQPPHHPHPFPSHTLPALPPYSVIYPSGPSTPLPSRPSNRQHGGIPALLTRRRVHHHRHRGRDCYGRVCASVRGPPPPPDYLPAEAQGCHCYTCQYEHRHITHTHKHKQYKHTHTHTHKRKTQPHAQTHVTLRTLTRPVITSINPCYHL